MRTVCLASLAIPFLLLIACIKDNTPPGKTKEWDVRGNYAVTYDNQLKITLTVDGVARTGTSDGNGKVDFGQWQGHALVLDIAPFCARPEVVCPSEFLWNQVAIDEIDVEKAYDIHVLNVIDDTQHVLPAGKKAKAVGGLVGHTNDDRFVLGLGADGRGAGDCALLSLALAGGRFSREHESTSTMTVYRDPQGRACAPGDAGAAGDDGGAGDGGAAPPCNPVQVTTISAPVGAAVEGIKEGRVGIGWLGACAFGGNVAALATLTIETGYTAARTGDFDPPPFAPVPAPPLDGGTDDGALPDGGGDAGAPPDASTID
jgi:hypothetical protein